MPGLQDLLNLIGAGTTAGIQAGSSGVPASTLYGAPEAVSQSGMLPWSMPSTAQPQQTAPTFQDFLDAMGINLGDNTVSGSVPGGSSAGNIDLTGAVQDQFAPIISHLQNSIGRTKKEGAKTDAELKRVFGAVAKADMRTAQKINKSGRRTTRRVANQYDSLGSRVGANNDAAQAGLASRLKGLGIGAATQSAGKQLSDQGKAEGRAIQGQGADATSASINNTENWRNFARGSAINTRLEGANTRADLASQLSDLIFGIRGQIATTRSDKATAMASAQQAEQAAAMQEQQMAMQAAASGASSNASADSLRAQLFGQFTDAMTPPDTGPAPEQQNWDLVKQVLGNTINGPGQGPATGNALQELQSLIPQVTTPTTTNQTTGATSNLPMDFNAFEQQMTKLGTDAGMDPKVLQQVIPYMYQQFYGG